MTKARYDHRRKQQARIEDTGSLEKRRSRNNAYSWKDLVEATRLIMTGVVSQELSSPHFSTFICIVKQSSLVTIRKWAADCAARLSLSGSGTTADLAQVPASGALSGVVQGGRPPSRALSCLR